MVRARPATSRNPCLENAAEVGGAGSGGGEMRPARRAYLTYASPGIVYNGIRNIREEVYIHQ